MDVSLHDPLDLPWLDERIAREENARQRDRYRAVRLALEGEETLAIVDKVGRSRKFVQEWVYRYRDGGKDNLLPIKQPGAKPKLPPGKVLQLQERLDAPPREDDGVCTLRGRDIQRILEKEFGVVYSGSGTYQLLHRLNYSSLRPRPKHRKTSSAQQEEFQRASPFLSRG
jgi:transposase